MCYPPRHPATCHLRCHAERTTASKDAIKLTSELLRLFVLGKCLGGAPKAEVLNQRAEAIQRATTLAKSEGSTESVDVVHLERILPQLLLDF